MTTTLLEPPPITAAPRRRRGRLLLVAYCFPPVGGAGVQRPVKWVKYLHRAGWDVTVLTPSNPSVPARDESLLAEVPEETVFLRPRTWEPDYQTKTGLAAGDGRSSLMSRSRGVAQSVAKAALQPDPQVLWYWNAVREAARHLTAVPHDAIVGSAPPYSSVLLGRALQQRSGLPLVLDYRDEWDLSSRYLEHAQRDWFSQFVQERMQRRVLGAADAVIATTQASADRLTRRLRAVGSTASARCIYNGFDAEDFGDDVAPSRRNDGTFRLIYTGTLWNLTSIQPLVQAVESLNQSRPDAVAKLELICVGRKTPEQTACLERLQNLGCRLSLHDYCAHDQVLDWMHGSDALCLLLSDVPGADRVVPAKLFEYLAARKDLLAIVPDGEAAGLVERFFPEGRFAPSDVAGIRGWLESRLDQTPVPSPPCSGEKVGGQALLSASENKITSEHRSERSAPSPYPSPPKTGERGPNEEARLDSGLPMPDDIDEFSRERQAGRLLAVLQELTAARRGGGR
ncbi:MAG TPA: glycosyltransferase [Planctomycetaceae bacterium]|nr:glycosyltransferase [Planctomycetaceae bacterium]